MKNHYIRYIFFWAPAFIVAMAFNNSSMPSRILQWASVGLMLLGWCFNTVSAAYYYPRTILSALLMYLGVNQLLTVAAYHIGTRGPGGIIPYRLLGFACYTPLEIIVTFLLEFDIPQEVFINCFVFLLLMLCWAAGVVYARLNPNPYRPRISGRF